MPHPILMRKQSLGLLPLDPGLLPNLEVRLSGVSLAGAADALIPSWADTSGNGRTAAQGNATQQPRISGVNSNNPNSRTGRLGANFNFGENDNLQGSLASISQARGFTYYAWIFESPFATATANQVLFDDAVNPKPFCSGDNLKLGFTDKNGQHESATTITSGYHSVVWVFYPPNTTGIARVYQDGVLIQSTTWDVNAGAATTYEIGNNSVSGAPFGGEIFEFDYFTNAHDPVTIQRVLLYGKRQWGI